MTEFQPNSSLTNEAMPLQNCKIGCVHNSDDNTFFANPVIFVTGPVEVDQAGTNYT